MLGEIAIFNDYYKSLSVRIYENGEREIIISSRVKGTWHERTLNEDKVTALVIAMDKSIADFEEVQKMVFDLIGNPDDYCTDATVKLD